MARACPELNHYVRPHSTPTTNPMQIYSAFFSLNNQQDYLLWLPDRCAISYKPP